MPTSSQTKAEILHTFATKEGIRKRIIREKKLCRGYVVFTSSVEISMKHSLFMWTILLLVAVIFNPLFGEKRYMNWKRGCTSKAFSFPGIGVAHSTTVVRIKTTRASDISLIWWRWTCFTQLTSTQWSWDTHIALWTKRWGHGQRSSRNKILLQHPWPFKRYCKRFTRALRDIVAQE